MRRHRNKLKLIFATLLLTGCATARTVTLDSNEDVVRLGPDVRGHVYFYSDGKWQLTGDKINLPEGWYAGPMKTKSK